MPKIAAGFWQLVAGSLYILLVLSLFVEHQYVIRKKDRWQRACIFLQDKAISQKPATRSSNHRV
jgi:hypothetical protein